MSILHANRIVHGFVVAIGPENNRNYFTGTSYSAYMDEAKVFRSTRGALSAAHYWQHADHNPHPLPAKWWEGRCTYPVSLCFA